MTKLEKVIAGLQRCCVDNCTAGSKCLYYSEKDCVTTLLHDALGLLKEREPRVLTWEELIDVTDPVWYEDRNGLSSWALCTDVTYGNVYEDMSYEFFENFDNSYIREYANKCNVYWRCWSAKPTDEQRKAVKWDE